MKTVGLVLEAKPQYSVAARQGGGERSGSFRKGKTLIRAKGFFT